MRHNLIIILDCLDISMQSGKSLGRIALAHYVQFDCIDFSILIERLKYEVVQPSKCNLVWYSIDSQS